MSDKRRIYLFDTTCRDGAQTPGLTLRSEDKLRIARMLSDLGIDYAELGWPGANPTDSKVFSQWADENAGNLNLGKTKTVSFGMVRMPHKSLDNDATFREVLAAPANTYCLFGKTWDRHVELMNSTPEEYLRAIRESVSHAAQKGEAIFDAEHFFQGYVNNPDYALAAVKEAYDAGARWVVLCDTNGRMTPTKVQRIVSEVRKHVPGTHLGIHTHNDRGLADANTLAAIEAGCCHAQGTINGLGERCGNANLVNVISTLVLDEDYADTLDCRLGAGDLIKLAPLSRLVADISRRKLPENAPFIGVASGWQKAGKHADMHRLDPNTYRSHDPALFGVEENISVSNQSGISNFLPHLERMGLDTSKGNMHLRELVQELKSAEEVGFEFENGMGSFEALALRTYGLMPEYFQLSSYRAIVERLPANGTPSAAHKFKLAAQATVEFIDHEGSLSLPDVSNGNGPVNALDKAMRRNLMRVYPELQSLRLIDFTQDVIDRHHGTDATIQVKIVNSSDGKNFSTIGVSGNSIDASVNALMDSYALHLYRLKVPPRAMEKRLVLTGSQ